VQVKPTTCKSGAPTQDGSRSSLMLVSTSATSNPQTDALMYTKVKMLKDKRSKSTTDIMEPTKDGRLDMLTLLRLKLRDNLIRSSDFTLRETSTLFHHSIATDTLT
jgi:hypothetical protein